MGAALESATAINRKIEMKSERVLSEKQVEEFHRDGFLVVRGMYSPVETKLISAWTDEEGR